MDIEDKKEKLLKGEITVESLTSTEVKKIKKSFKAEIEEKKEELKNLNQKIRQMKVKIDNWNN